MPARVIAKRPSGRKLKIARSGLNKSREQTRNKKRPDPQKSQHLRTKPNVKTLSLSLASGVAVAARKSSGGLKGRVVRKPASGNLNASHDRKPVPTSSHTILRSKKRSSRECSLRIENQEEHGSEVKAIKIPQLITKLNKGRSRCEESPDGDHPTKAQTRSTQKSKDVKKKKVAKPPIVERRQKSSGKRRFKIDRSKKRKFKVSENWTLQQIEEDFKAKTRKAKPRVESIVVKPDSLIDPGSPSHAEIKNRHQRFGSPPNRERQGEETKTFNKDMTQIGIQKDIDVLKSFNAFFEKSGSPL